MYEINCGFENTLKIFVLIKADKIMLAQQIGVLLDYQDLNNISGNASPWYVYNMSICEP